MPKTKLSRVQQDALAAEFSEDYGIEIERFDPDTGEPSFTFEQLQLLTHRLCEEIAENEVEPGYSDLATGEVTARTIFQLKQGTRVTRTGRARIGQTLRSGETIEDEPQALGLAKLNSFRDALRAIGFNPLAAHRARRAGEQQTLSPGGYTGEADSDLQSRKLHALAAQAGYIKDKDHSRYRALLQATYGVSSSVHLNAAQKASLCLFLQADIDRTERIAA